MKTRNGFVSNSSSSNFIVAFSQVPETIDELKHMMFGDVETIEALWDWQNPVSTHEMAEVVFRDMEKGEVDHQRIVEEVKMGWFPGCPHYSTLYPYNRNEDDEKRKNDWNDFQKIWDEQCNKVAQDFMDKHPDVHFFVFSYSDNDGELYEAMEHGEIFDKIPHLCISHH